MRSSNRVGAHADQPLKLKAAAVHRVLTTDGQSRRYSCWDTAVGNSSKDWLWFVGTMSMVSLALIYFIPAPPSTVTMATAFKGSSFEYYGRRYREIFARSHVQLDLRETDGAVENVKLLQDPKSGVQIALAFGGISNGEQAPGLLSLGTVYNNPFWIFYSANDQLDSLAQLKGKRIAVGPVGSGTRSSAEQILGKGGVNSTTATLLPFGGSDAVAALNDGKVDVVWIAGAPDATAVHSFLRNPNVRLMSFPMAEAFTRIFPELVRLVLPQGVIDIDHVIPSNEVILIGTTAKILVRSDLHPQIVQLLLQTMVECMVGQTSFSAAVNSPTALIQSIQLLLPPSIFTERDLRLCRGICLYGSLSMPKERSRCWWPG